MGTLGVSNMKCFKELALGPEKPRECIDPEGNKVEIQISNLATGKIES